MTKHLEHGNARVCKSVADALGKLGEHAASAVPELTKYFADEYADRVLRRAAADALGKLGEHAASAG